MATMLQQVQSTATQFLTTWRQPVSQSDPTFVFMVSTLLWQPTRAQFVKRTFSVSTIALLLLLAHLLQMTHQQLQRSVTHLSPMNWPVSPNYGPVVAHPCLVMPRVIHLLSLMGLLLLDTFLCLVALKHTNALMVVSACGPWKTSLSSVLLALMMWMDSSLASPAQKVVSAPSCNTNTSKIIQEVGFKTACSHLTASTPN
jgi:hypothetical protein